MADDTEQKPVPQPQRREISRRPILVGLIGLGVAEAVAGGITWKVLSQGLHKIALAFAPPVPTPTSLSLGATLYTYRGHSSGVNAVKWSPDSKRIVSGSDDQTAQEWDATTGQHALIYQAQSGGVLAVAWSPDSKHIALGGGAPTPTPVPTAAPTPTLIALAPASTTASGDTPTPTPVPPPLIFSQIMDVWDVTTRKIILIYRKHTGAVCSVAWSSDGNISPLGAAIRRCRCGMSLEDLY